MASISHVQSFLHIYDKYIVQCANKWIWLSGLTCPIICAHHRLPGGNRNKKNFPRIYICNQKDMMVWPPWKQWEKVYTSDWMMSYTISYRSSRPQISVELIQLPWIFHRICRVPVSNFTSILFPGLDLRNANYMFWIRYEAVRDAAHKLIYILLAN